MAIEQVGPNTPLSPPDAVERELEEAERLRREAEEEAVRKEEEIREEHGIDEFA